jgi:peptide/nickel transport system substrate-binding protein
VEEAAMQRRSSKRWLAAAAGAVLVLGACSSDDGDGSDVMTGDTTASSAGTGDTGTSDTGTGDTTDETTDDSTSDSTGDSTGTEGTTAPLPGADDVGTVGGSGCGVPHGPYDDPGEPSGEVRVAWNDPLLSFNGNSSRGNAVANNNPLYLMGLGNGGGFTYYDGDLNLINNDQFGTCTVESLDPLTVTYRINEGVTWSDGTQVDAADLVMYWGATSGLFNDAESVIAPDGTTAQPDADGLPIVLDPSGTPVPDAEVPYEDDGSLPEGYSYQESTGVSFDAANASLELVTQFPEISDDGLAATITWDSFYVDYQQAGLIVGVPAHVVARNALGIEDAAEAKQAVIEAFRDNDTAKLKPISDFWNTGFDATELPSDSDLYLSVGPYELTSYDELSQMTFEANPDYTWGPRPKVATIVYRIIGDPTAAVQALENEEVDIIEPQSTADLLTQVQGLEDRGVEVLTGDTGTYEHVDLVFDNGGPFDPATYGGDEATALAVRQAFLKTIPRQDIVDRLVSPLNPDAQLRDSFTTVVGAPTYDELAAENGSGTYADVDIEGAKQLLADAGVTTPIEVRFLFADNNPRRANEFDLISASAAEAGFTLIDGRSPTWGQDLDNNTLYDASLFGWQSTAVAVADSEANFVTGGQNNYGHYSSQVVDDLYTQLKSSTDADEQQDLLLQIEQALWADGFGVTLFQHPGLTAFNSNYVSNVSSIPLSPTVFWNVWEWEAA